MDGIPHADEEATDAGPSSLPEFAEIFSFIQLFGELLYLPKLAISELESFFTGGEFCSYVEA